MTVLILSNTANIEYYNMLETCVNSIQDSLVVVVETNSKLKGKDIPLAKRCKFIFPDQEFNYNKFLNIGLTHIDDEKIIISNNDVIFSPGCISEINTRLGTFDSVSPFDFNNPKHKTFIFNKPCVEGYDVGVHVTGCCIGLTRTVLNKIQLFDESFKFWYQDNDYANLLKKNNIKNVLLRDAKITHLGFQSHKLLKENLYNMTHGLEKTYKEKWFE